MSRLLEQSAAQASERGSAAQASKREPGSPEQASPRKRKRSKVDADAGGLHSARHLRLTALELLQVLPPAALWALRQERFLPLVA